MPKSSALSKFQEQRLEAEADAKRAKFTLVPHHHEAYEAKGFKCYEVNLDGKRIGSVFQSEQTSYKTYGRVRYGERKTRMWCYDPSHITGLFFTSRKAATEGLILDVLREPERLRQAKAMRTRNMGRR